MKIQFLKKHNKYQEGEVIETTPERAKHWIKVKAAIEYTGLAKPKRARKVKAK